MYRFPAAKSAVTLSVRPLSSHLYCRLLPHCALALCAALIWTSLPGCGAPSRYASKAVAAPAVAESAAPAPLERSLFARDPRGFLDEDALQRILQSPLELALPARVGVVPVVQSTDWRGPNPSYDMAPAAIAQFADGLRGGNPFTMVTEMLPVPSGSLGMESLRELAGRYKLRYMVLYRENVTRDVRVNPWATGYITLLGALFLPGDTLRVHGYVEASLFDVKTGLLLFTVRRRVRASEQRNVWHTRDKLDALQQKVALTVANELAGDLRGHLHRYARAVELENQRHAAGAEGETTALHSSPPSRATNARP